MRFIVNVPVTVAPTKSRAPDAGRHAEIMTLGSTNFLPQGLSLLVFGFLFYLFKKSEH